MTETDATLTVLRLLVYVGSVAAAGGVLFLASFPRAAEAAGDPVQRQIAFGAGLLLVVEPLRYAAFQMAAAGWDASVAFGPELRWMAFATPMGRAAAVRFLAAALLLAGGTRSHAVRLGAAGLLIGSFLLEGHTMSQDEGGALASGLLLVHVLAVHWWLGALIPLIALLRHGASDAIAAEVRRFGALAVPVVGALVVAGAVLLGILAGWQLKLHIAYQQRFLVKIGLVGLLLAIALWNKARLTSLLVRDPRQGRRALAGSIRIEILVALAILAATSWALQTSPDM